MHQLRWVTYRWCRQLLGYVGIHWEQRTCSELEIVTYLCVSDLAFAKPVKSSRMSCCPNIAYTIREFFPRSSACGLPRPRILKHRGRNPLLHLLQPTIFSHNIPVFKHLALLWTMALMLFVLIWCLGVVCHPNSYLVLVRPEYFTHGDLTEKKKKKRLSIGYINGLVRISMSTKEKGSQALC